MFAVNSARFYLDLGLRLGGNDRSAQAGPANIPPPPTFMISDVRQIGHRRSPWRGSREVHSWGEPTPDLRHAPLRERQIPRWLARNRGERGIFSRSSNAFLQTACDEASARVDGSGEVPDSVHHARLSGPGPKPQAKGFSVVFCPRPNWNNHSHF